MLPPAAVSWPVACVACPLSTNIPPPAVPARSYPRAGAVLWPTAPCVMAHPLSAPFFPQSTAGPTAGRGAGVEDRRPSPSRDVPKPTSPEFSAGGFSGAVGCAAAVVRSWDSPAIPSMDMEVALAASLCSAHDASDLVAAVLCDDSATCSAMLDDVLSQGLPFALLDVELDEAPELPTALHAPGAALATSAYRHGSVPPCPTASPPFSPPELPSPKLVEPSGNVPLTPPGASLVPLRKATHEDTTPRRIGRLSSAVSPLLCVLLCAAQSPAGPALEYLLPRSNTLCPDPSPTFRSPPSASPVHVCLMVCLCPPPNSPGRRKSSAP